MERWIIRTESLRMRYRGAPVDAVEGLEMTVETGTIHGILGPNGAGKTTTLSMLCGLLRPTSGAVRFPEEIDARGAKNSIGFVPQDLALYEGLTGRENLRFFARIYSLRGEKVDRRIEGLLEMVGLADRADDLVRRYSTGMKRRLNLAAGLVHSPRVILLDEPTVGIDPQSRNRILEAVAELKHSGAAILYTTHYMEEASRLCDSVAIMDHGRILLEGPPALLVAEHGKARMVLESDPPTDDLVEPLAQLESVEQVSRTDDVLVVRLAHGAEAMDVIHAARESARAHGIRLALRAIEEPSLETIFLDITGRELRDGQAGGWDA